MDTQLTIYISCQLHQPIAVTSSDATNCYDRINHFTMSPLFLEISGCTGAVTALLSQIQVMNFFQRIGLGNSTTFMGGPGLWPIFQGLY